MKVYCVMIVDDDEYGCRDVESIWADYKQAEAHIAELGQETLELWFGDIELYTIEEYDLQGLDK